MASAAELMVLFKGDTSGLDKATGESKGLIGGLVDGLGKLGLAGMGFGVIKDAASAIIGPLGDSISAAEGLGDAVARSEGVFGPASASIVSAAESQANALGLTKEAYIAAAAKTGDLVTSMGIGKEKAAEMSAGFADLAPKLAAYTGMDVESASAALTKGLTGATKGLKDMGIVVGDIPKGLDDAAKAQFVYDAVLKQSGEAQKAWAGNSGDVETSMARVSAAMTDAKAAIGDALLPVLAPLAEKFAGLASMLTGAIGPAITLVKASFSGDWGQGATDALKGLKETFGPVGEGIAQVAFAAGHLGETFSRLFSGDTAGGISALGDVLGNLITAVERFTGIDLTGAYEFLYGNEDEGTAGKWDAIAAAITSAFTSVQAAIAGIDWAGIGQSVMTFAGYFKDGLMVVLPIVAAIFKDVLWPVLQSVFGFFKEHTGVLAAVGLLLLALTGPIGAVVAAFTVLGALGPQIGEWVTAIGEGLVGGIGALVGGVVEAITAVVDAIIDTFKSLFGIASPSTVFNDFGVNLLEGLIGGVQSMIATVIATFGALGDQVFAAWESIKVGVMATVEMIRVMISAKWDAIGEYLSAKLEAIGKAVADAWAAVTKTIEGAMQSARDLINAAWDAIGGLIHDALNLIENLVLDGMNFIESKTGASLDAVRGIFDSAMSAIHFAVDAVVAFLKGDWGGALDYAKMAAEDAWSAIKQYFAAGWQAIKSILKVDELVALFKNGMSAFSKIGGDIVDGIKAGISRAWDALISWLTGLAEKLPEPIRKALGMHSPSTVMRDQVGIPIGQGIIAGVANALKANPIAGIVSEWATAGGAATIGAALGGSLKAAIVAGLLLQGRTDGGALIEGKIYGDWGANAKVANGRMGLQKGPGIADKPDDNGVRADAFRSGRGGLLAASSSNYWQVFVQRFGVPTEASARKVSKQLGIPLPKWLEDIFHPPQGETVDAPDALKDPAPAQEAGAAMKQLAKAANDAAGAIGKMAPVGIDLDALRGSAFKLRQNFDDLIPIIGGIVKALPPGSGGRGGIGIPIPGPGGSTTFGGGGSAGIPDVAINAQSVQLRGPLNLGLTATLAVGGGRSLTAELVSALVVDTPNLDKLIEAEDRRRAQKS